MGHYKVSIRPARSMIFVSSVLLTREQMVRMSYGPRSYYALQLSMFCSQRGDTDEVTMHRLIFTPPQYAHNAECS